MVGEHCSERIEAVDLTVKHSDDGWFTTYMGAREQLIAAGVAMAGDFPAGRKRVAFGRGDAAVDHWTIKQQRGGLFSLTVKWSRAQLVYLQRKGEAERWIAALPGSADSYRAGVQKALLGFMAMFRQSFDGSSNGGYRMRVDTDDYAAAVADLLAVIENAPVRFSQAERNAKVRAFREEAERLDPRFRGFLEKLTEGDFDPADVEVK